MRQFTHSWLALALFIAGLALQAAPAEAEPVRPDRGARGAFTPTHVVSVESEYYTTGPQQGRPPDGRLKSGTRVALVKSSGSYSQVRTEEGLLAWITTGSLTRVLTKIEVTPEVRVVADSVNGFAFDLYGRLRSRDGNLFFSPASISTAFAMTYAGAAGQTEREMAQVLRFDRDPAGLPKGRFHEVFGTFHGLLNSSGEQGGYVLRTANRLWGQKSYEFVPAFRKVTREQYGAELATVDFARTEPTRQEINTWVERQTQGKIADLIPSGVLTPDTRLVLTNAIYFLGGWEEKFPKAATKDSPFFVAKGQQIVAPLMHQTDRFRYAETAEVQLVELRYRGGETSMVVLLPRKIDGLAGLETQLSSENVLGWLKSLQRREVDVFLPRFGMTRDFPLSKTLREMGMATAFSEAADFSKMSTGESLMISDVLHKAFVDVNETGTEAAAATAVVIAPTSAVVGEPEKPVVFRADHPFVFLIRENRTGAILFLGRVVNPKG